MKSGRRGTYVLLALLGLVVALVTLAGTAPGTLISPLVLAALIALYLSILIYALGKPQLNKLGGRLNQIVPPLAASAKTTPAARKANQRARNRFGFGGDNTLLDIGLLVNEKRQDGRWNRRLAESVALDDGAIQPFVNVLVPNGTGDRPGVIEFELYDQAGRLQFNHRVEQYIRDGHNLILCDRQLPVRGNTALGRSGTWDLRVTVDGALVGIHDFSMTPKEESRPQPPSQDSAAATNRLATPEDEDEPMSLEDLLREQRQRSNHA